MVKFSNRLVKETSPYLLQHAHNPVDWFPWGEEALAKAKAENKPILVSIGYAACHWCHVMERESFEDEETARLMNAHFINIKVDREERPDLDHIYMDAVQAITGSGGWPLNVFLTPDAKPFYGGTYFPPIPYHNRPSWKQVLSGIAESFHTQKDNIDAQARYLTEHLMQSNAFSSKGLAETGAVFNPQNLGQLFENLIKTADKEDGGFGQAPKFPQTFAIQFLLHFHHYTQNEDALKHACLSLDKMIQGGIYDHIGGGFARYSTDSQWLVPHFEKMLYDNALLIIVLSECYQITHKESYRTAIEETIEFVKNEMMAAEGGFYSSLDADSEGEEGKYYLWKKTEIDECLKEDSDLFCTYYHVSENGNWEGSNILHSSIDPDRFAGEIKMDRDQWKSFLQRSKNKLLLYRAKRAAPLLDKKIIVSCNALMNVALSKACGALGNEEYKHLAVKNMQFLLNHLQADSEYAVFHCYTDGEPKFPGFLDDYAFLISAFIQLQEITSDADYLIRAKRFCEYVIENFSDEESLFLYYSHRNQKDLIYRKIEIYDGATPSGNSVMAFNMFYLSVVFDIPEWKQRAVRMCSALQGFILNYPGSFGVWATLLQAMTYPIPEIVITGKQIADHRRDFLHIFLPYKIFQSATHETEGYPLLDQRPVKEEVQIYLCKDYSCLNPVTEIVELKKQLSRWS